RRSPPSLRSYAVLLANIAFIDLVASIASLLTITRVIPVGEMIALIYNGPCVIISGFFCNFLIIVDAVVLTQTHFLIAVSFAYRLYVLVRPKFPSRRHIIHMCLIIALFW
ncbi:hypothetical protein PMAYCL1PPCAC_16223, partial [Pristionchus mayeri]